MKKYFFLVFLSLVLTKGYSQTSQAFIDAQAQADADSKTLGLRYLPGRNIYIGARDNVIHIFLFEDGNVLLGGYPTTATERNLYQVHLYITNIDDSYLLQYTGVYQPVLNIQSSATPASNGLRLATDLQRLDFAKVGPFTDNLVLTLKKKTDSVNYNTLANTTIQISKTFYASIGSGIVFTTLKNPKNIKAVPGRGGDSTLIGDDPKGRALLTIMATFYPWGRNNLMMPSWGFKDRFGIVVGTTLGTGASNFGDLMFGGQYDFSIGGSFVAGLHYGRVQKVSGVDFNSYQFGETKFSGNLVDKTYMAWRPGFFFGVQLDSRIFSQIFK